MAVEGVNLQRPTPQMQFGRLTAITTDFNTSEDEAAPGRLNTLLQHSLPATGGASGSPMLNERGEVVGMLSAVNFAMLGKHRIPTGVGVNFAQRANLVSELIDDDDASHAARSSYWNGEIQQLYASGKVEEKDVDLEALVAGWESKISVELGNDSYVESKDIDTGFFDTKSLHANPLVLASGDELGVEMYARDLELKLAGKGNYLLAAESDGDLKLELEDGSGVVIRESIEIRPGLKAISFTADGPATLRGRVLVNTEATEMRYSLREAKARTLTPELVLEQVKSEWIKGLQSRSGGSMDIVEVGNWSGDITDKHGTLQVHAASQPLTLKNAGPYLIAAIAEDRKALDMRLVKAGDADGDVIAEDDENDWYPCIAIDADGGTDVLAELFAPEGETSYRVWLFTTKSSGK